MNLRGVKQFGRLRRSEDREFLQPGMCDAVLVNANQLENNLEGTAAYLEETKLPFMVDPMLWRLQLPAWWRNAKGDVKRNYARLAARYSGGTKARMAEAPLLDSVAGDDEWRRIAQNTVAYQAERLREQPDLFHPEGLRPEAIVAPALVTLGPREDRINGLLAEAAAEAAGDAVVVTFVLPRTRLSVRDQVARALAGAPSEGAAAYLIWTPEVTEASLLTDHDLFEGLLLVIRSLTERGVPVMHLHGSYVTEALCGVGLAGVVHHLGWVDTGEPAAESRGAIRSCQTYVPGIRHCLRFNDAQKAGRHLDADQYRERYCDCRFCVGVLDGGQHPLDFLLEDTAASTGRRTPTSRAVAANSWHYLNARRQEVEAFGREPVLDVLERDIERAAALAGDARGLERLAEELRTA